MHRLDEKLIHSGCRLRTEVTMAKIVKPDLTYQWASAAGGGSISGCGDNGHH